MEEKKTAGAQIKEIAERLGVSQSTVSVVLGGRGDRIRISKETQKKVRDMAREMNYRPNIYARRLRHAEEEVPYVVVVFWRIDSLNSRVGRFIRGLYEASKKRECRVELMIQPYKPGELMSHADMLSSNRVSGAIISGLSAEDQTELEKQEYSIPIVLIERESTKFHCITMDTYRTGEQCIAYMSAPEIKTAAFIGFGGNSRSERKMEAGFMFGCRDRNIKVKEDWNVYLDCSGYEKGYAAAEKVLANIELPSAWLVADGRLAGGIMDCCQDRNIRVPEDVRIIFFEESAILKYHKPPLSSVDVPAMEMAETALDIVLLACNRQIDIPIRREHSPLYFIRESSGKQ
ncbi:MAG: LacI family transcriptional regulator [Lachnospiraceae bacterium]|jgi:LacI family transcriptional regulator|nr:LacI family transcriptional regulator [Lachnospiraceae bacterium]